MDLGPGHKPIVFGGSRSKVKVTEVKKPQKWKLLITSLVLVVETQTKKQNVQDNGLYNPGMINRKYH